MKFTLLTTGGTIDSYSDLTQDGKIVPAKISVAANFLKSLQPYFSYKHKVICQKDSRDINNIDRQNLLREIQKTNDNYILITHGTYTMPDTARFIEKHGEGLLDKKVIIFTGSMSTLIGTINDRGMLVASDGSFNLGFAIASFEALEPGMYLCMTGKIFRPLKVKKNVKSLRFFEGK